MSLTNVYSSTNRREFINQEDIFGFQDPKPVGFKGTEAIWPRSYSYSAELVFDENGSAYPIRPRTKAGKIIQQISNKNIEYDEVKNINKSILRRIYSRFKSKQ